MRGFIISVLICLFLCQTQSEAALFHKKDYKHIFLNNALKAEKRRDYNQAFHAYEKAIYYYKKDKNVLEAYAQFCERQKYFDKAEDLYGKLYILTKDPDYQFKKNLCAIKNGKLSDEKIQSIINNKSLTSSQKISINKSLIFYYAYKNDWIKVKKTCDKVSINQIGEDSVTTCIAANEHASDKKTAFKYYLRHYQLFPKDTEVINRIIELSDSFKDYSTEEKFIKKLSTLNPKDNGIKYKLAGLYEKQKNWHKASKLYEGLMASGDKSEHVTSSYAYVLSQLHPKKQPSKEIYTSEPPSEFKLAEKNFYHAWKEKNYKQAQSYLDKMLKEEPRNKKLLRHKVDIDISQGNYIEALKIFEELLQTQKISTEDAEFLAFLYSKTENYSKALEIIQDQLKEHPINKTLLNLALEYSLAEKDWDTAILYNAKLLEINPKSEKLLKQGGNLYSIKQDFLNASKYYEKLVKVHPTLEYKMALANLYMANKDFDLAQNILEPLYYKNPNNIEITEAFINSLLAQQRTYYAYEIIRKNNLLNTKEGYVVLGDLNLKNKQYSTAANNYFKALQVDPKNNVTKNNLAYCYRMLGHITGAANIYKEVLFDEPQNLEAKLGLGSIEIDKKNFDKARRIFRDILKVNPDYRPAWIAIAHSYNANGEKLSALEALDKIIPDDETNLLKAQIYYDMDMLTNAKQIIKNTYTEDSEALKYQIRKNQAITVTPTYSFLFQQLADEFNLDYQKYGIQLAQKTDANTNAFLEYNIISYSSGSPYYLTNVTNEIRGGVQARPSEKFEYRADLGVRAFQFGGAMITTDSWIKRYFNDKFNLKLGFKRTNLEQSYLSAVGEMLNGIFTGRVADNRLYLEYEAKLPKQFYTFGRGVYGVMTAQNLPTNQYLEGLVGIGRPIYDNPRNPWIQKILFDVVSYNTGYQYNLLNLYNNIGTLYGGYFSPSYFNATTGNVKMEGFIKKWNLKYGLSFFGGLQDSMSPDKTTQAWGFAPFISYNLNDHISINASYNYYNYADVQRHYFMVNAVIRGFREHGKK